MPSYVLDMQVFLCTGDRLEIDAINEDVAEQVARAMCEERFENGAYDGQIDISEICVSSIYRNPYQDDPPTLRVLTPAEHALNLLDDLNLYLEDVHNPIPSDLHERVQAIKNALKGANP